MLIGGLRGLPDLGGRGVGKVGQRPLGPSGIELLEILERFRSAPCGRGGTDLEDRARAVAGQAERLYDVAQPFQSLAEPVPLRSRLFGGGQPQDGIVRHGPCQPYRARVAQTLRRSKRRLTRTAEEIADALRPGGPRQRGVVGRAVGKRNRAHDRVRVADRFDVVEPLVAQDGRLGLPPLALILGRQDEVGLQ